MIKKKKNVAQYRKRYRIEIINLNSAKFTFNQLNLKRRQTRDLYIFDKRYFHHISLSIYIRIHVPIAKKIESVCAKQDSPDARLYPPLLET